MFVKTFLSFPEHTNHSFVVLYPRPLKEKEQMMPTLTPPTKPSCTVKRAQASYRAAYLFSKLKITLTSVTPGTTYTPTHLPDCTPPLFQIKTNRIRQDIRDDDNKLIPPWEYKKLATSRNACDLQCFSRVF